MRVEVLRDKVVEGAWRVEADGEVALFMGPDAARRAELHAAQAYPAEKPHMGRIRDWRLVMVGGHRYVEGTFLDHYRLAGHAGHTSTVVHLDRATGELETRNSRYTLLGPPSGDGG